MNATIAIIGAGPSGLFGAELLAAAGASVTIYDHMPSAGRKFLMAGRGGLNLTHSEPLESFLARYGESRAAIEAAIRAFPPENLRQWADGLGAESFVGSSGRVFPRAMKASPLLRAWLRRLDGLGVAIALRHRLIDLDHGEAVFETPDGRITQRADGILFACGGGSWAKLGSDGAWREVLEKRNIPTKPFAPSNGGVIIPWTSHMACLAGQPLKRIVLRIGEAQSRGEALISTNGLEGGAIYALSPALREALSKGNARLSIDLRPDLDAETLAKRLSEVKKGETQTHALRRLAGLADAALGVLREGGPLPKDVEALAQRIKHSILPVTALAPIDRAISSVGGLPFEALDDRMMIRAMPGVFAAGEMLDFDAPTGGYLLQACFSTAHAAAHGMLAFLARKRTA
jgi:uncharacterized flavoprotein (TIGR03862 family)